MKTIGMIGGMSWESTIPYYREINQQVKAQLGGFHSAKIILISVDFAEIEAHQRANEWEVAAKKLANAAQQLQNMGADCIILCTNTMHIVADQICHGLAVPFLHIADATAQQIKNAQLSKIGLLGTRFTMERDFYIERLQSHQLEILVPTAEERKLIDQIIFNELCQGIITEQSKQIYRGVMHKLAAQGAEGIILGCTEIALLVGPDDAAIPLFDTAKLHAQYATQFALA
ncbi:aspartate/glutamate racemase family protein [Chitinibacter sp. SCUT-21]|uniref:aspartate/glutamate racemase family protein n=1 Tax=Chitinibacter sp. SCUT-21 TaxID=2970891 RepID=UPI0035A5CB8B